MKIKILIILLFLFFLSAGNYKAAAQKTGTRLKNVDSSYPESVIWFSQPHEIKEIRSLIQEGEKELAEKKVT